MIISYCIVHISVSCIRERNGNPLQCSCLENPRDGGAWWAAISGVAQSRTRLKRLSSSSSSIPVRIPARYRIYPNGSNEETLIKNLWQSTFQFPALEKEMAIHSSVLAWRIPGMAEPDGLLSMGSHRVGHDWATSLSLFTFIHWRRKWQPTPVFLPGESQRQSSLVGCHLWGRTESDTTEAT